jgi:AcrR family transcriptional regulator
MTLPSAGPMSERPLRADALRNRIRILIAAESVFAAKGIDASTDEVARLAGVGIGTLYRHFSTKQALLEAVFAARMQRMTEYVDQLVERSDPGKAISEFFMSVVGEGPNADPLTQAGLDAEAAASHPQHPLRYSLAKLLERAQRSGQIRQDVSVTELVSLLPAAVYGMRLASVEPRGRSRVLAIILDGIRLSSRIARVSGSQRTKKRMR